MKQKISFLVFVIVVTVVSTLTTNCSSTGVQRSTKASTTMQTMDDDIKSLTIQLDATGASLDELMREGQSEIKPAFELFTNNVSKMESMEKKFTKHSDEMNARGKDYFEEWQQDGDDYKNLQIKELGEQRRTELAEIYGRIAQNSVGVKETFKSYVSDIKEIQNYISNDLTTKGIEAIRPVSVKVVNDGENLKSAIKDVQRAIDRAREEMSQSGK